MIFVLLRIHFPLLSSHFRKKKLLIQHFLFASLKKKKKTFIPNIERRVKEEKCKQYFS